MEKIIMKNDILDSARILKENCKRFKDCKGCIFAKYENENINSVINPNSIFCALAMLPLNWRIENDGR